MARGDDSAAGRGRRTAKHQLELVWPGKKGPIVGDDTFADAESVACADDLVLVERLRPSCVMQPGEQPSLPLPATDDGWRNMLVYGDNLVAMQALHERLRESIDLIYIDPPYATGLSYYRQTDVQGSNLERRAYRDNRAGGMAGYLEAIGERLAVMHSLLAPRGKLFVHCDWRANSMLRLLLDEIFGPDCFRNEIIWRRAPNLGRQAASKQLGRVFDSIYVYSKTPGSDFAGPVPRRRAEVALDGKGKPKGARWDEERECFFTTAPRGDYTDKSIASLRKQGRVYDSSSGKIYIKYFLIKADGRWCKEQPVDALWDDFDVRPLRHRPKSEEMGYDTQKPEGLLERIIGWATKPGDLVADFYSGSGTTAAVAEGMGRRWVACDSSQSAIDIARRRLLGVWAVQPDQLGGACGFEVRSVLRATRRKWALDTIGSDDVQGDARPVIEAFGATPTEERWGSLDGARVCVGALDRAVGVDDIECACRASREAGADELVMLAWEWAPEDVAAVREQVQQELDVRLTLRTVPLELTWCPPGRWRRLRFAQLPELELELVEHRQRRRFSIRLTGLRIADSPPLPKSLAAERLNWSDLIDGWMVDWSETPGAFEPSWYSYRSRTDRQLALSTPTHDFAGACDVQVKVVTVFGDEIVRKLHVEC